LTTITSDRIFK